MAEAILFQETHPLAFPHFAIIRSFLNKRHLAIGRLVSERKNSAESAEIGRVQQKGPLNRNTKAWRVKNRDNAITRENKVDGEAVYKATPRANMCSTHGDGKTAVRHGAIAASFINAAFTN